MPTKSPRGDFLSSIIYVMLDNILAFLVAGKIDLPTVFDSFMLLLRWSVLNRCFDVTRTAPGVRRGLARRLAELGWN